MRSILAKRNQAVNLNENDDSVPQMPKKKFYRARAHCNPLSHNDSFQYPLTPNDVDWNLYYPNKSVTQVVSILDIGMGFGGLTISLAKLYPEKVILGMEIRAKVCEYVRLRIEALRKDNPGEYENASCLRTNCMRYLPNFFKKSQIEKIFICFPDPHFKTKNFRRRIVSSVLLSEYAFFLQPGGMLYLVTDVAELHQWHVEKCNAHPYFKPIIISSESELSSSSSSSSQSSDQIKEKDSREQAVYQLMLQQTEESKKVTRMSGNKYFAVYRRVTDEEHDERSKVMIQSTWFT